MIIWHTNPSTNTTLAISSPSPCTLCRISVKRVICIVTCWYSQRKGRLSFNRIMYLSTVWENKAMAKLVDKQCVEDMGPGFHSLDIFQIMISRWFWRSETVGFVQFMKSSRCCWRTFWIRHFTTSYWVSFLLETGNKSDFLIFFKIENRVCAFKVGSAVDIAWLKNLA